MKYVFCCMLTFLSMAGCEFPGWPPTQSSSATRGDRGPSLVDARRGFTTNILAVAADPEPVPHPPEKLFNVIHYESPAGKLAAYVSRPPKNGTRHPAILWIFGGFDNSIGATAWSKAPPKNDQSASAFRNAGIVMMYPSLRGGNNNPGQRECLFGEVDDVLAAGDYLAKQDFVDPDRIYLGGHSTGGTLAMLVAACPNRFRAVFALGPVDDVASYGTEELPFDVSNRRELELRSPRRWLDSVKTPVFAFEGTQQPSNLPCLNTMARSSRNERVRYYAVPATDHFSVIAPLTRLLAKKVLADDAETTRIAFTEQELAGLARP
jgi:pimeloyl-ACP methyl ester carboxylesterase